MRDIEEAWEEMTPRQLKRRIAKWVVVAILVVAALGVVGFVSGIISLPFRATRGVLEKTLAPDAIIGNYQWYYDQYNAILAQKANLAVLPAEARERPGLLMVLNGMIGDYNSRSKQITRNLWKAVDLPYQITMEDGR
jgi:hypothetical protein